MSTTIDRPRLLIEARRGQESFLQAVHDCQVAWNFGREARTADLPGAITAYQAANLRSLAAWTNLEDLLLTLTACGLGRFSDRVRAESRALADETMNAVGREEIVGFDQAPGFVWEGGPPC